MPKSPTPPASQRTMLARLRPYDGKRNLLRRFMFGGTRFEEARGWYRITEEVGQYLVKVRQDPNDVESALAFDVMTEGQARAFEETERKKAELRAVAAAPNVVDTVGLTALGPRSEDATGDLAPAATTAEAQHD